MFRAIEISEELSRSILCVVSIGDGPTLLLPCEISISNMVITAAVRTSLIHNLLSSHSRPKNDCQSELKYKAAIILLISVACVH